MVASWLPRSVLGALVVLGVTGHSVSNAVKSSGALSEACRIAHFVALSPRGHTL